jgi:hypothetical protein
MAVRVRVFTTADSLVGGYQCFGKKILPPSTGQKWEDGRSMFCVYLCASVRLYGGHSPEYLSMDDSCGVLTLPYWRLISFHCLLNVCFTNRDELWRYQIVIVNCIYIIIHW